MQLIVFLDVDNKDRDGDELDDKESYDSEDAMDKRWRVK